MNQKPNYEVLEQGIKVLGYHEAELKGRNNREFVDKANADKIFEIFHTIYETGRSISDATWEFITKEGTRRHIEASVSLMMNSEKTPIGFRGIGRDMTQRKQMEIKQAQLIADLNQALGEVNILHGLLPICASCKKIRDDKGYWNQIESYIQKHSKAQFSLSMCPECSDKLYGTEKWYIEMKKNE